MEHPCYKCGQAVEEGTPFCKYCSAPQIRVVVAEPVVSDAVSPDSIAESETPAPGPAAEDTVVLPVRGAHLLKPSALAALVAAVLTFLGLKLLVAMVGVGFLAVVLYRQFLHGAPIRALAGAWLGALSGLFFFGYVALVSLLAFTFQGAKMRDQFFENAQKWMASRPPDPQIQAAFEQMKTPEGFAMAMAGACVVLLVLFPVLASLGGMLAAAILGRRGSPR